MAIHSNGWLITSDLAHEVAFRVDVPGRDKGLWILSYLPHRRITREQALAGVALAETILKALNGRVVPVDIERARWHAKTLDLSVKHAAQFLALRASGPKSAPVTEQHTATGLSMLIRSPSTTLGGPAALRLTRETRNNAADRALRQRRSAAECRAFDG